MARGAGRQNAKAGAFGTVHELPSGRLRAMYRNEGRRYSAPTTFTTKMDARGWLALQQADIIRGKCVPPTDEASARAKRITLTDYAEECLRHRDVKPRTREHYRKLLDVHVLPGLVALPLASITPDSCSALARKARREHADAALALLRPRAHHPGHRDE